MATEHTRWKSTEGNWFDTEKEAMVDETAMLLARLLNKFKLGLHTSIMDQTQMLEYLSESICENDINIGLQMIEILKGRSTIKPRRTSK